ncbi:MAG: DUF4956 domain-containing protein [Bacteroidales bacterium]
MFNEFQFIDPIPLTFSDVVLNLFVALLCGLFISIVYRLVYNGPSYSPNFVNSIALLTLITALVIMVIGNNLARAFGLVGAMSIIRFRTAVRDTLDIVFIFYALAIGMACGVGLHGIAIGGTIVVNIVIITLVKSRFANPQKQHFLMQISYDSGLDYEKQINKPLQRLCKNIKLVSIKNIEGSTVVEAFFHVNLRKNQHANDLVDYFNQKEGITAINLFFDEIESNSGI